MPLSLLPSYRAGGCLRRRVRLALLACVVQALVCPPAYALDPNRTIVQLRHTAWGVREGAPAEVVALAQTPDGFLWLGTATGLFRFDGIRFERVQPRQGRLLGENISALLPLPGGQLFVGFRFGGVSLLSNGVVTNFPSQRSLPPGPVYRFAVDREGVVWAATLGGLARFAEGSWTRVPVDPRRPDGPAFDVSFDRAGVQWVDGGRTLLFRRPGEAAFSDSQVPVNRMVLAHSPNGTLWLADGIGGVQLLTASGKRRRAAGTWRVKANPQGMIVDRDGNLWVATMGAGVQRVTRIDEEAGRAAWSFAAPEAFTREHGMTTNFATSILEDREGNIWVGTRAGLERFRNSHFAPLLLPDYTLQLALGAGDNGTVWVGSYNQPVARVQGNAIASGPMPSPITCAYRDPTGAMWLGGPSVLWRQRGPRFDRIALPRRARDGDVQSMVMDAAGDLWVSVVRAGLFRLSAGRWFEEETHAALPNTIPLVATRTNDDRLWFGYPGGRLVRRAGQQVDIFGADDGIVIGDVTSIFARGGHLWIGGSRGFAIRENDRFRRIEPAGDPLEAISGIVETTRGDLWLSGSFGVARVDAREVAHALNEPGYRVSYRRFDYEDGLPGLPQQSRPLPSAIEGSDGRLWFTTIEGAVWIDPNRIVINELPPPVVIRTLTADGAPYDPVSGLELPIGTRELQIEFTALSLSIPERLRFRFRLDGADQQWRDAGNRREAFYTNLEPGSYRFQVVAANNDGVWNDTGQTLSFTILPAFYQTAWFATLCAATGAGTLWGLYRWRLRRLARRMRDQLEVRLVERTRIARELHDTLVQGFISALLQLHVATVQLPESSPIHRSLTAVIDLMERVIEQGRNAVSDLRSASASPGDLEAAFAALDDELGMHGDETAYWVTVGGDARPLNPAVRDEVYWIGREAVVNACRHSGARLITVELEYTRTDVRLKVCDNGRGIDEAVLQAGSRGHWGLVGMRERAQRIGARLTCDTKPGGGTRVTLVIPNYIAFASERFGLRQWLSRRATRRT